MKNSALAAGLKAAAVGARTQPSAAVAPDLTKTSDPRGDRSGTVLIGGHYPAAVRRALLLVQAQPENEGRNMKQLLGEAINDLCAKYGIPEPYAEEV
jgi:hypothetical protein